MSIEVITIGNRNVCIKGVGKSFYQDGFPISMAVSELAKKGTEVSFLHLIEEFWEQGWSWKTIEMKLRGEESLDIEKVLNIDYEKLLEFYSNIDQPLRRNGGYEKSREMIFEYLFGCTTDDVRKGKDKTPLIWLDNIIKELKKH